MSEQPKRVGRPAKKPELGPRKNVTFRLNEQVMDRVQALAAEHGRSASEEIERRIEASFHDDDAMRVIRETIRQEMRAEFAGRAAAKKADREAEREKLLKFAQQSVAYANQGQQWSGAALNSFSQNYMAVKTEPEKA